MRLYDHIRGHRLRHLRSLALLTGAALLIVPAQAEIPSPPLPRTTFGNIGLVEMPSARFAADGELSLSVEYFKNTQRYNLGFQILPWLEGSFRYTGLSHYDAAYPVLFDRSFAVKARLFNETAYMPAIAVGMNDLVGTGIYGGEYIVASKQFGSLDATIGMGWGRLSTADGFKNPLGAIANSFYTRKGSAFGGGQFDIDQYFHGPKTGVFGGMTWRTPLDGLTLVAEYSSDNYEEEARRGNFSPRNQINLGASYHLTDSVVFGLQYLYGHSIGGSLSFELDPVSPQFTQMLGPDPLPAAVRSEQDQRSAVQAMLDRRNGITPVVGQNGFIDALYRQDDFHDIRITGRDLILVPENGASQTQCRQYAELASRYGIYVTRIRLGEIQCQVKNAAEPPRVPSGSSRFRDGPQAASLLTIDASVGVTAGPAANAAAIREIRRVASQQKLITEAVTLTGTEAIVYYDNPTYSKEDEAVGRLIRVLMAKAPPGVEKFRLISVDGSVPQREFDVLRGPMERLLTQDMEGAPPDGAAIDYTVAPMNNPVLTGEEHFPKFNWNIFPQFRQALFDPSNPFGAQLLAGGTASIELLRGLSVSGEGEINIVDNFSTNRPSDSVLPHVRTDFSRFFTEGKNGISYFMSNYDFRLMPDVFASVRAGYLESMYAGAGGEVLWRPEGQRWALGADLFEVKERNFDRLFGLQSYHATTGHVSVYYQSPWYGLNFAVSAGQYLAGDRGVTLQVTRRFETGIEIGAFMTKTNVSAADFGEGSFDKGIFIRIPLDWMFPIATRTEFATIIRPIQRDGGQRLANDTLLYDRTQQNSYGNALGYSDLLVNP